MQRKLDQRKPMLDQRLVFFEKLSKWIDFVRNRLWMQVVAVLIVYLYNSFYFYWSYQELINTLKNDLRYNIYKEIIVLISIFSFYFIFYRLYKYQKYKLLLYGFIFWFFTFNCASTYCDSVKYCAYRPFPEARIKKPHISVECEVKESIEKYYILAPFLNSYTMFYMLFEFLWIYTFPVFILVGYIILNGNIKLFESKKIANVLEMNYLKNQTSPHFLFNGLNNIYGLLLNEDDRAKEFIVQFQNLFNFSFDNISKERISLESEINYITNYLNLENIRRKTPIKIKFDIDDTKEILVAPFLFFTLIENAVKHGFINELNDSTLNINLRIEANNIIFKVKNSVSQKVSTESRKGIGLKNLKRQLEILYPRSSFNFSQNSKTYEAIMVLPL